MSIAPEHQPSADDNPYSAPASQTRAATVEITGGTPFRGELTPDDIARAERLHARALALSPGTALVLFVGVLVPIAVTVLLGVAPVDGVFLAGFVAAGLVVTRRWQIGRRLKIAVPAGPFAGAASHEGLRFECTRWNCQLRWHAVSGYVADEELVVFYLDPAPIAVPKQAFADERAWAQFCETVLRSGVRARG